MEIQVLDDAQPAFEPSDQSVALLVAQELRLHWPKAAILTERYPHRSHASRSIPSRRLPVDQTQIQDLVGDILERERMYDPDYPQHDLEEMETVYLWEQRGLDNSGFNWHFLRVEIGTRPSWQRRVG
jgi:hypothetical protein